MQNLRPISYLTLLALSVGAFGQTNISSCYNSTIFFEVLEHALKTNLISDVQYFELKRALDHLINSDKPKPVWPIILEEPITEDQANWALVNTIYGVGLITVIAGMAYFLYASWKQLSSKKLISLMVSYFTIFTCSAYYLWHHSFFFLGGVLVLLSLAIFPSTVYAYHQKLRLPMHTTLSGSYSIGNFSKQLLSNGFIVSEISTIIVGLIFLLVFQYSFLVFPMSVAFFLFMLDLSNFVRKNNDGIEKLDLQVSLSFSACIFLIAGSILDSFGLHHISPWLWGEGVLCGMIQLFLLDKHSEDQQNVILSVSVSFIWLSYFQQRSIMLLLGSVSLTLVWFKIAYNTIRWSMNVSSYSLYYRVFLSAFLLSLTPTSKSGFSDVFQNESMSSISKLLFHDLGYLLAIIGLLVYNLSWAKVAHELRERHYVLHLLTNLGFVRLVNYFRDDPAFSSQYYFSLEDVMIFTTMYSGVLVNMVWALFLHHSKARDEEKSQDPNANSNSSMNKIYYAYRILISVVITCASVWFKQYSFVTVGASGVSIYLWLVLFFDIPDYRVDYFPVIPKFIVSAILCFLASLFGETKLFLVGTGFMMYCLHFVVTRRLTFLFLSTLIILLSGVLDSRFLFLLGSCAILFWCYSITKKKFQKNGVAFAVSLIAIGGTILFMGLSYQHYQGILRDTILEAIVKQVDLTLNLDHPIEKIIQEYGPYITNENTGRRSSMPVIDLTTVIVHNNLTLPWIVEMSLWPYPGNSLFVVT
eukprot:TRINITY_DN3868_c0_g1_i1.p1 TRINITY_DN3868_c0_g1~~TRINITY_DN3868_c0_g1_i1.p1  ORF type:complete len:754 (-),score=47.57 TRINITY_DN3868_c0_g1_i1:688-2949(-)